MWAYLVRFYLLSSLIHSFIGLILLLFHSLEYYG